MRGVMPAKLRAHPARGIGGSPSRPLARRSATCPPCGRRRGPRAACDVARRAACDGGWEAFPPPDVLPRRTDQGQAPGAPPMRRRGCGGRILMTPPHPFKEGQPQMFTPRRTLASSSSSARSASPPAVATPTPRRSSRTPRRSRTRAVSCRRTPRRPPRMSRTARSRPRGRRGDPGRRRGPPGERDGRRERRHRRGQGQRQRAGRGPGGARAGAAGPRERHPVVRIHSPSTRRASALRPYPDGMARVFDAIDDTLRAFIERQHVFFVATAPSGDGGHVNVSPKGGPGMFRVTGPIGLSLRRHARQRRRDGLPPAGERAHLRHVHRVRGTAEDPPPPRHGRVVQHADPQFEELLAGFDIDEDQRVRSARSSPSRSPASPTRAATR